nr:hypothetical protein [Pseudomonas putida]
MAVGGGHCWDKMYCPLNDADCLCGEFCIVSVWSTPKSAGNFARQLRRVVDNCSGSLKASPAPNAGKE